jgi:indole-3-glycerol phosphate synthase
MSKFNLDKMRTIKFSEKESIIEQISKLTERKRAHYKLSSEVKGYPRIIAEIKKSSPTMQVKSIDPAKQAIAYVEGGASAISVLIDNNFFSGSWDDLQTVTTCVDIPVLCKEFIYYKEQIDLAYLCGADLILLIARVLSEQELSELYQYALSKKITPLIEINQQSEMSKVLSLQPEFLMVNMRNLKTLELDIEKGINTLKNIPNNIFKVSASAMKNSNDIKNIFQKTGTELFLIGSAIMASESPSEFIKDLKNVC